MEMCMLLNVPCIFFQAVYLCGIILLEESSSGNDQFSRYAAGLAVTCKGGSILSLLETILQNKRGEEFSYLTQWVLQQLRQVRDSGGTGSRSQQGRILYIWSLLCHITFLLFQLLGM